MVLFPGTFNYLSNHKKRRAMMRIMSLLFILAITITGCKGQKEEKKEEFTTEENPKTNIVVNKEYDDDGNLIRYDSTYSYYYSNVESNEDAMDSIYNEFRKHFNNQYFFSRQPFFEEFFFEDSLLKYDFYKEDFFFKRFENNMKQMEQLFRHMDSVKNAFYENQEFKVPEQ